MRPLEIDHDQIGLVAGDEGATVRDTDRAVAVGRRPAMHLLGARPPAVPAPHALHEQPGTHHLDHVLRHVVAAHGDVAAVLLQVGDARAEPAARGDGGVEGDRDTGPPQPLLLLGFHAAAVGADQALVEKAQVVEIFGRQTAALGLDGCHLAPDLVEVDGGDRVELLLQGAHLAQQLGRAHIRRPGGYADADAPLRRAVALAVQGLDAGKAALAQLAVHLERGRIADRALGLVPCPLGEKKANARGRHVVGVGLDARCILQDRGGAAADRLQNAQLAEDAVLLGLQPRQRQRGEPARERRLVRRRQVFVDAARQRHVQVSVHVGEARHHRLARAVDTLGRRVAGQDVATRPHGSDPVGLDRHRPVVDHGVVRIDGDHRSAVNDNRHCAPLPCRTPHVPCDLQ